MDLKEIEELKKIGAVKRKSEFGGSEYEYSFKVDCADCGGKVEHCFCAETLEGAKSVIEAKRHYCNVCWGKPQNMNPYTLRKICEMLIKDEKLTWDDAVSIFLEQSAEYFDGDPYFEGDEAYWPCECPVSFDDPDQTEE